MNTVIVSSAFDDMRTPDIRFLNEASMLGRLHVMLWSDDVAKAITGKAPKFPLAERLYFVDAMRCVKQISVVEQPADVDRLPTLTGAAIVAVRQSSDSPARREAAARQVAQYAVINDSQLGGFPPLPHERAPLPASNRKKIIVTGCYDWFHTGHVRFFEEVNDYGDVYVCVGNDANLLLLKGPGHPQFPQDERRYVVASTRFVHQALITTGSGWMDAEPEIARLKPDIYAVNEDGDKPEKREFCRAHGLEYLVLKRLPKPGLIRRSSTDLRGF